MGEAGGVLVEIYQRAYTLGEELLDLLQSTPTEETLTRVEALIEVRAALAEDAALELSKSGTDPLAVAALARVLEQQVALTKHLSQIESAMRRKQANSQRNLTKVQMAGRVLSSGPRSKQLNERR